jgi:hypothetical protein
MLEMDCRKKEKNKLNLKNMNREDKEKMLHRRIGKKKNEKGETQFPPKFNKSVTKPFTGSSKEKK